MTHNIHTVCLYCGSSAGTDPVYAEAAATFGRTLVERGHHLVYGGGSVGLMGLAADAVLEQQLSAAVVQGMGSSYRPKFVVLVRDLPKTRNMKIMRRVVRAVVCGESPGDLSSLSNPEAVEELRHALQAEPARR